MQKDYKERMAKMADNKLFDILDDKESYQKDAIIAVIDELNKRGFSDKTSSVLSDFEDFRRKQKLDQESLETLPELYSSNAIIIFSIFFTAIGGAIMMAHNFKQIGNQEKSKIVLQFGCFYAVLTMLLIAVTDILLIQFLFQLPALIGGYILVARFEKYYPEDLEHRTKPVRQIVINAVVITVGLLIVASSIYLQFTP